MDMHILTFDRLSKALVIGGAGLFVLGLLIACLKAHRIQETDSAVFWLCVAVTLVVLVLGVCFGWGETTTRFAGLGFQVVGILVALYALQDVRIRLDQPGVVAALAAIAEKPFKDHSGAVGGEGALLAGSALITSEGTATLTTHPSSLSTGDRFNALEDQVARLEAMHAQDTAALRRAIRDNRDDVVNREQAQMAAVKALKELVVELLTGGLPLAFFGLLWLFIGAVLSSLPTEVAGLIKRLHS